MTSPPRSKLARWAVGIALGASPLAFTACGPTPSTSRSSGAAPSLVTRETTTTTATGRRLDGLDLAKLGSLTNYTATMTDSGTFTLTYRVHSPSDWEIFSGRPSPLSVNVGGSRYAEVPKVSGATVTYSWRKTGRSQPYAQAPYPSYAGGFAALTHVTGARVVKGGLCRDAGVAGHLWHFAAAAPGAVYPHVTACIADRSGVLLTYRQPPIQTFAITSINDVSVIPVP
ncbi:MAG TPA: hypothetical protein VMW47_08635 [Verrucomicrobiae bacterium]|nr:hypothetical protein [Verrucomicrobiae bacterium]